MHYQLFHGDNREQLKHLADNSIDSIVCDPPYELGFMGKRWDSTGIAYDRTVWAECLRVLKPGGHLIAFGGTRTYHRMTVAIEDAGFEIRDCIMWLYGSGFPKSLAIDKAIDKQRHDRAQTELVVEWLENTRKESGVSRRQVEEHFGTVNIGQSWFTSTPGMRPRVPTLDQIPPLLALFGMTLDDVPEDIRTLIWTLNGRKGQPGEAWYQREVVGERSVGFTPGSNNVYGQYSGDTKITAPATDLAKQWHGWGTALKPAVEPAVLARKPLIGTVADNVTTWGVGGINVDGCRVGSESTLRPNSTATGVFIGKHHDGQLNGSASGRWPANVILDESAGEALDAQSDATPSRFLYTAKASKAEREAGLEGMDAKQISSKGNGLGRTCETCGANTLDGCECENRTYSNPSRLNHHPTVKPIALMRYLVRLVTPKGGTVLDPFMGSGSTGCAAMCEGVNFVGIELSEEYLEIARRRIEYWQSQNPMGL